MTRLGNPFEGRRTGRRAEVKAGMVMGTAILGGVVLAGALVLAGSGCGSDASTTPTKATSALTFWQDVAPIYGAKCVKCHQDGGIGPFRLDNFVDAKHNAAAERAQVSAGTMPPYFERHDGTCGDFHAEDTLTADEKKTVLAWLAGPLTEGALAPLTPPRPPTLDGAIEIATPTFSPVAQGGSLAAFDEYRCFPMDSPTKADAFLTGYVVTPGNATIVHHVLGFIVDPAAPSSDGTSTNAAVMAALDAESPDRIGWPCFGAAGDNVEVNGVPVTWAPGQGVVAYPDGMGVPMRPTDKLVVQVHYNLSTPGSAGSSDTTRLGLRFADHVDRHLAFVLPDPFLDSLSKSPPDSLPPGQANATYTWTKTVRELGLDGVPSVDLMAIMPHMHGRGVQQTVRAGSPGAMSCISELDNWNFHWQRFYTYRTQPRVTPDTTIEVTCDYNTSADTAPVLPGWGTQNEMCLPVLMIALPPSGP
jgi:hypothetical protein